MTMLRSFTAHVFLTGICISMVIGAEVKRVPEKPKNLELLKKRALAAMEDIAPNETRGKGFAKIIVGDDHALWGNIFADSQIAALVAVNLQGHPENKRREDENLCLLLWSHGWKFYQYVGKVSPYSNDFKETDWMINQRESPRENYVLSSLDDGGENHLSWLCDPKTHTLIPTGWPKDALPSISGNTITFIQRNKKNLVYSIYQLTDQPGKRIVSFHDEILDFDSIKTAISIWDSHLKKMVVWHILSKSHRPGSDVELCSLCKNEEGIDNENFRQDAVIEFTWRKGPDYARAKEYVLWQLSGASSHAINGRWDEEKENGMRIPISAKVTGLPEAVELFTWPKVEKKAE